MGLARHDLPLRLLKLLNIVLMTVPFGAVWLLFYWQQTASPFFAKGNWLVMALFLFLYLVFGRIYEAFMFNVYPVGELVYSQGLAVFMASAVMYIVTWLLTKHLPAVWPMLLSLGIQLMLAFLWAWLCCLWYNRRFPAKQAVVIYGEDGNAEQMAKGYSKGGNLRIVAQVSVETALNDQLEVLEDVETVILCGIHSHERNIILKRCVAKGITAYIIPRLGDVLMSGARRMHLSHQLVLRVGRYSPNPEYVIAKRLMDILLSALALILCLPAMLVTAAAIKLTDGGPVFYRQTRLTKDGKRFEVLKFRSMRTDAEKDGVARLSTGDKDDRITPVGRVIRKVRIDELPQFINIIKGDMSIVGPRPERPEIAAQYMELLPEFELRLQAKAGLTGYAQVYGKYNTTPYDKLQMDLAYISKPSLAEDIRIILATVKILFMKESTEGFEAQKIDEKIEEFKGV